MIAYLASHILALLTATAWLLMLARVSSSRRAPQSTLAWLLAFALAPFIAIPLYLALGQRKFPRRAKSPALASPPLRSSNAFELLTTGDAAFARLLQLLREAEGSVDVTMFILGDDATGRAVVAELCACAARGVRVRVILDAVGSFWTQRKAARELRAAGAEMRIFMPLRHSPVRGRTNLRSHRKLVIVDGHTVLGGGMNLAREYMGPPTMQGEEARFVDLATIARGPVAADAAALFQSDWEFSGGLASGESGPPGVGIVPPAGETVAQFLPSGPDMVTDTMYDLLLTGIFGARERVAIVTPYFVPDEALQHALVLCARRGVETDILVPAWSNHLIADVARRSFLRELGASGARIHYYTRGMVHAKATLIDDEFAYVGSINFDMRSLFLNYEDALCIYSREAIQEVRTFVDGLIAACPTDPPIFPERPVIEQLALLVAPEL